MKPSRIILIRHGESEGNLDKTMYANKPDYALLLTEKGKQQAAMAGKALKELVKEKSYIFMYRHCSAPGKPLSRSLKLFPKTIMFIVKNPVCGSRNGDTCAALKNVMR